MGEDLVGRLREGLALTGDLAVDVPRWLRYHGLLHTARHSAAVAQEAALLAERFGADSVRPRRAGWLHDISAVIPAGSRLAAARALGLPVLQEEAAYPAILHQGLAGVLAHDLFGERDGAILTAIACHTTLRRHSTSLDRILFVADKLAWDQPGEPPYLAAVRGALERSLEAAALAYLQYLWDHRETLGTVHPWMVSAYRELACA